MVINPDLMGGAFFDPARRYVLRRVAGIVPGAPSYWVAPGQWTGLDNAQIVRAGERADLLAQYPTLAADVAAGDAHFETLSCARLYASGAC